jgi:GDPmannose 4,6-dehydratase
MKKALILGISGQDGSYLSEYLLDLGYEVHGVTRNISIEDPNHRLWRLSHIMSRITLHAANIESYSSIFKVFQAVKPDECYHLASESFVSYSFDDEYSTMNTNINGTHHVLSSLNEACPDCKLYFAGSSEMFGNSDESPQNEFTKFNPRSIYGISKLAGYQLARNYREKYNIFACSGILFNHESPRRGFEFVTRKISSSIAKIKLGISNEVCLGNLDSKRDWGFSGDYIKAMHAMLQHTDPDDYVIATGKSHSVRDVLEIGFNEVDLNYQDYVKVDNKFFRPAEQVTLLGNASKARKQLDWNPLVSFEELIVMMVKSDIKILKNKIKF